MNKRERSVPLHRWLLIVAIGLSVPAVPNIILTWIYKPSGAFLFVHLLAITTLVIVSELRRFEYRQEQRRLRSGEELRRLVLVAEDNRG